MATVTAQELFQSSVSMPQPAMNVGGKWGLAVGHSCLRDDTLIVLSDQGELLFAPASPEAFTPLSRGEALDGKCWSVPVLVRKRIYCRNADGRLVCVNVELKPSAASVAPTP